MDEKDLDELVGMKKTNNYKKGYMKKADFSEDYHKFENQLGDALRNISRGEEKPDEERKGYCLSLANEAMEYAVKTGHPGLAYKAALMYELFGRGSSPSTHRRLKKSLERCDPPEAISKDLVIAFKKFIKRNPERKFGLEGNVLTSIFGVAIVVGILFGLNSFTGAAIGFNTAPSTFLGAILFLGGIVGLYFSFKK
jgi:hypothetical protein